jgi:hypothetical protein
VQGTVFPRLLSNWLHCTVSRWPSFRLNNSKEAQKTYPWSGKIRGRKIKKSGKSDRKGAGKFSFFILLNFFFRVFSHFPASLNGKL